MAEDKRTDYSKRLQDQRENALEKIDFLRKDGDFSNLSIEDLDSMRENLRINQVLGKSIDGDDKLLEQIQTSITEKSIAPQEAPKQTTQAQKTKPAMMNTDMSFDGEFVIHQDVKQPNLIDLMNKAVTKESNLADEFLKESLTGRLKNFANKMVSYFKGNKNNEAAQEQTSQNTEPSTDVKNALNSIANTPQLKGNDKNSVLEFNKQLEQMEANAKNPKISEESKNKLLDDVAKLRKDPMALAKEEIDKQLNNPKCTDKDKADLTDGLKEMYKDNPALNEYAGKERNSNQIGLPEPTWLGEAPKPPVPIKETQQTLKDQARAIGAEMKERIAQQENNPQPQQPDTPSRGRG